MRVRVSLLAALTAAALAPAACTIPPSGDYDCHITYGTTGPSSAAGSATCTPVTPPASATPSPTVTPTSSPVTTPPPTLTASPTTAPPTTPPPTTPSPTPPPVIAFPDASNTGVPDGVTLTAYTGPCTITTAAVIDAKTVSCDLVIRAAVTITRSRVNGGIWLDTDLPGADAWSVSLYDSEVAQTVRQSSGICCGNMDVQRSNLHGGQNAVQCEERSLSCRVTGSWLHGQDLPETATWHLDGFLSDGTRGAGCTGAWCIELVHNTIVCDAPVNSVGEGCTADVGLIPNFATVSRVRLAGNLLGANAGSAYCLYGGEKASSPFPHGDHITVDANVFARGGNAKCAAYGPVTDFRAAGTGNVWTGNTWDSGEPLNAPA